MKSVHLHIRLPKMKELQSTLLTALCSCQSCQWSCPGALKVLRPVLLGGRRVVVLAAAARLIVRSIVRQIPAGQRAVAAAGTAAAIGAAAAAVAIIRQPPALVQRGRLGLGRLLLAVLVPLQGAHLCFQLSNALDTTRRILHHMYALLDLVQASIA